ncbi:hypothetical protein HHX48_08260 [Salinimonas sp. HHU 13199]|uniref:Uncharacterized protein n=1 Tax=Salinimonas profundi TaxID=2729140 RepID=A0ABR8LHJ3_9ALTE|nr:hypothetical protein [Salinimonas profundi]MBD3585723.1 hypothetical protein [Salinimonas profundi]
MVDTSKVPDCELSRRLGGDTMLVRKLLSRFSANLPILIVRLSLAIKSNDVSRARSQITMLEEVAKAISASDLEVQLSVLGAKLTETPSDNSKALQAYVETIFENFREHLQKRFSITLKDRPDAAAL